MSWWHFPGDVDTPDRDSKRWLALAVACLIVSGLFATILLAAHTDPASALSRDPFLVPRLLVVHVHLALVTWPLAFLGAMFAMLPVDETKPTVGAFLRRSSVRLALLGAAWFALSAGLSGSRALPTSYIPTIDNALANAGMLVFVIGIAMLFVDGRLWSRAADDRLDPAAVIGLRAAGAAVVLTLLTLLVAWLGTPTTLSLATYHEVLYWGPGHMLQFAAVAGMLVAWILLLQAATGSRPLSPRAAAWVFVPLVAPLIAGPFMALAGTTNYAYTVFFTRLMQWGIFPFVLVFLVLAGRALLQADRAALRWRPLLGFALSALLVVVGMCFGAILNIGTTLAPAHFHAAVGGVTVAYMAASYMLLVRYGWIPEMRRVDVIQVSLFGIGMLLFVVGFAVAGFDGMPRRCFEQLTLSPQQTLGMNVLTFGGLMALAGGALYAWRVGSIVTVQAGHRVSQIWGLTRRVLRSRRRPT